jgi:uncharacterized phage protein (TIGR01671 family)
MRNPKYRAWDKVKKEWIVIGFSLIGEVTVFDMLKMHKVEAGRTSLEALNDIENTEFSGLREKKDGKEIYEGDYIKSIYRNGWWQGVIVWHKYKLIARIISHGYMSGICLENSTDENGEEFNYYDLEMIASEELKIIGNIFETPKPLIQVKA